jgi:acetyltransferase
MHPLTYTLTDAPFRRILENPETALRLDAGSLAGIGAGGRCGILRRMSRAQVQVHRLHGADAVELPGLSALLIDAVHGGASVGFLAPLDRARADAYWREVFAGLGAASWLWVARQGTLVVGSVQLALGTRENGRHRAEVQKLFVLRSHRGRGVATQLMTVLEAAAREAGRTLLVLDTEAGSGAEAFYARHGWQRVGEIPDYAADPAGVLHPTALHYKRL